MERIKKISIDDILNYETHSSRFLHLISNPFLQKLTGKFLAWKVRRKYNQYIKSINIRNKIIDSNKILKP